ncbi:electron transfer flavoprotein subunit alpha/FixB family protein [Ancylobacter mangrovi]|uniref:electron transfer flavoprotein subunit alpha/FixB family protein n=1 Tax=Ancylobacter mangrovi TaxID=2972472 RepID=UPI00216123C6|nr:FAD-binding protein [Ancylobacter mangrovi]MCS0503348.1 FAD-binding protein [Ancylobacter mangrovi]
MTTLLIADHDGHAISPATARAATAARALTGTVEVVLLGGAHSLAAAAAKLSGVDRVLRIDAPGDLSVEAAAMLLKALAEKRGADAIVAAATSASKDLLPRLAALLDVMLVADVVAIESEGVFTRPLYAGNALERLRSRDPIKVLTIRATAFEAAAETQAPAPVEEVSWTDWERVAPVPARRLVSRDVTVHERPDLGSARVVVSGGRALGSAKRFDDVLTPLADALGAAIGATRAAVDAGYAPNDLQVGQTGKIVAPDLYIAVGVSGAIQHLAGMKDSRVIVAINTDPEAPIFAVADYGLVDDAFTAVPELTRALAES